MFFPVLHGNISGSGYLSYYVERRQRVDKLDFVSEKVPNGSSYVVHRSAAASILHQPLVQ